MKYTDKIRIKMKSGSVYPELAWKFSWGINAKKPAAHKANFWSKKRLPRRYIGNIVIIEIPILK